MLPDNVAVPLDSLEEGLTWLEAREDFQQVKAQYEALLEHEKPKTASQRTEELDKLPLSQVVKLLDTQLPFDLVSGIVNLLYDLGAFNVAPAGEAQSSEQNEQSVAYSEEVLMEEADLDILASVLPASLASKLGRSPTSNSHDDPSTIKASLLNTLARLSLSPFLTVPIARSFRPIFVDLASRWLLLLGFNGHTFETSHANPNTLVLVLAALARTLPEFPQLYPLLLIIVRHPFLQAESLKTLLTPGLPLSVVNGVSSAISPWASPNEVIYHPELPQLLLALYCVLDAAPQLPLMAAIQQNLGGPAPPWPVGETLSSHPHISIRTLAWQIASMWLGWEGPKKEELRRKYVYDPALDPENGKTSGRKTDIPLRDPEQPLRAEEWLHYWPRVPEYPQAVSVTSKGLRGRLEIPRIDAWRLAEDVALLSSHEWTVVRQSGAPSSEHVMEDHDMALDVAHSGSLIVSPGDTSPLLANIAGVATVKDAYVAASVKSAISHDTSNEQAGTADSNIPSDVFVPTSTAIAALRELAVHVSARHPVLLSSPPSAGKAVTLQELHRLLYMTQDSKAISSQSIVTINLADKSLDAKNLLGTLTSSPTEPGAFVFAEGSLTRAVRHGRWVVLEDIDKASDEVLSTVAEVVERIHNRVQETTGGGWGGLVGNGVGVNAGGHWIDASENFMLFATRSVPAVAAQSERADGEAIRAAPTFFGSQYWSNIWMDIPSLEEIVAIIKGRFPRLSQGIVDSLVQTWVGIAEAANTIYSTSSTGLSRSVGMRDLVNWCQRVEAALPGDIAILTVSQNPTFQEETFLEARDIFLNCFPTRTAVFDSIIAALQSGLEISQERADWLLHSRVPEVLSTGDKPGSSIHYGRVALSKGKTRQQPVTSKRPYALTKPFLVLLEELAACVKSHEPVLLVGETGTGKTTAVAQLADMLGHSLTALNLSNQTEASDLLGGFRPINEAEEVARQALQLVNRFTDLFASSFEASRNVDFGIAVQKAFKKKRWPRMAGLFREAARLASDKLARGAAGQPSGSEGPRKKRKLHSQNLLSSWQVFLQDVKHFEDVATDSATKASKFKFAFVEGPLVRALRNGDWVLLDEINLATSETLESLATILQSSTSSVVLTERGDLEPVRRHKDFRLFACMNPANDVGKRDLPPALRTRFTEIFVRAPDSDKGVLLGVVQNYIGHVAVGDRAIVQDIAELYLQLKTLAQDGRLADGSNHPPHFSMRTLARSLVFAADFASDFGIRRAAYEGIAMCFTTSLDAGSRDLVTAIMHDHLVERSKSPKSFFKTTVTPPNNAENFVAVGSFWIAKGAHTPEMPEGYVLTSSVEDKLINLTRAVAAARFPILLQGPTSSGKTSIIEYLAKRSGHHFVRINNHEHTDIQEYLGTYMSDPETGKLVFQEGLLVTAVRQGHWIVLDELNLAPTDVLEALNRLLDDNRELVIPETQEVVKPHPHFMLFATQNPPGLYGGRKVLSRAFRNRFLEMQFSDVPQDELETILCQRCRIAPSYARKIVAVFLELQRRRQGTRLFEDKQAFVTLRDLFRWGNRGAVGYEQLALDGYMLLAERTRQDEDKQTVQTVLEEIMKVSLSLHKAYDDMFARVRPETDKKEQGLVWTAAMKRLYVLIRTALSFNEPVLLVGETGSGKTSVCQAVAEALGRKLHIVNCHQNTETSDLIGSQRPVRNRSAVQDALRLEAIEYLSRFRMSVSPDTSIETILSLLQTTPTDAAERGSLIKRLEASEALFVWIDGPLVEAMKRGELLLLDEISLADDSVLERLNSVLEPARTLTVAEKGSKDVEDLTIQAHGNFQFVGTMNPGGDFGKKELSPALRNRFTEIWVPWLSADEDILGILRARLKSQEADTVASNMLTFARWITEQVRPRESYQFGSVVTLRDLLAWADFTASFAGSANEGFVHGAVMTLVDSLGSTASTSGLAKRTIETLREKALVMLIELASPGGSERTPRDVSTWTGPEVFNHFLSQISQGQDGPAEEWQFSFTAPTVRLNALRVMRALQVPKPILLEGSPGVGKTSLVTALAKVTRHSLCRINLSDQTDLVDLFGNDSPVEGGKAGEFAWVSAPFLAAMQAGHWVLLDEMNLASQSVLEGLNSCLDHRGTVYIPELDKVFTKHPQFRIFAAQNPTNQGGSRKGLPRSFVDRFTQVYMDDLDEEDYFQICSQLYPALEHTTVRKMVAFVVQLSSEMTMGVGKFQSGSPWELNLRDLLRWLSMMHAHTGYERHPGQPVEYVDHLFIQRFRQPSDRQRVLEVFEAHFGKQRTISRTGRSVMTSTVARIGRCIIQRTDPVLKYKTLLKTGGLNVHLRSMQVLAAALDANQLVILTGSAGTGKSRLVQDFSNITGRKIRTFHANAQTDTLEMLGSFEQCSRARQEATIFSQAELAFEAIIAANPQLDAWQDISRSSAMLSGVRETMLRDHRDMNVVRAKLSELQARVRGGPMAQAVEILVSSLERLNEDAGVAGRFEFVDGALVQAMKAGDILVIENANRCSPAVLDRLNGLFEPGGVLFLGERGLNSNGEVPQVEPHPNFRVVMTLDPKAGELSRAMRNRGVEVAVLPEEHATPAQPLSRYISGSLQGKYPSSGMQAPTIQHSANLDKLQRASYLHNFGTKQITSVFRETPSACIWTHKTFLHAMLDNPVWSLLAISRPGTVLADLPGQSHQITFFGLDTNEALADRLPEDVEKQICLDSILSSLIRIQSSRLNASQQLKSALSRPMNSLSVLEQSYLHTAYPARLPNVPKGVQSVRYLLETLVTAGTRLIEPQALGYLREVANLCDHVASFLTQLEALVQSHSLNYTLYQALLTEMQSRFESAAIPDSAKDYYIKLGQALDAAEDAVKRSTGHFMEPIWSYYQRGAVTVPFELSGVLDTDIGKLSPALTQLFLDVAVSSSNNNTALDLTLLQGLRDKIYEHTKTSSAQPSASNDNSCILVALSEVQAAAEIVRSASPSPAFWNIVSVAGRRSLRSLLPMAQQLVRPSTSPVHVIREWIDNLVSERGQKYPVVGDLLTDSEFRSALETSRSSMTGPLADISFLAQALRNAGGAHFELAATPKSARLNDLLALAMATISQTLRAAFEVTIQEHELDTLPLAESLSKLVEGNPNADGAGALAHVLKQLVEAQNDPHHLLRVTTRIYIAAARWIWSLYLPDISLDPALASQAVESLHRTEWDETLAEAAVEAVELREAGAEGGTRFDLSVRRLQSLETTLQAIEKNVKPRSVGRTQEILAALHLELRSCAKILQDSDILYGISAEAKVPTLSQLENLKSSLVAIYRRLSTSYQEYADIVQPLLTGLGAAILGVGACIHTTSLAGYGSLPHLLSTAAGCLVSKPSAAHLKAVKEIELPTSQDTEELASVPPAAGTLLRLHAVAVAKEITTSALDGSAYESISTAYAHLFTLWTIDHKRAEQARLQSESIYRSRREDFQVAADAQQEEEELLSLFPTFNDLDESEIPQTNSDGADTNRKTLLQYDDIISTYQAHMTLFGKQAGGSESDVAAKLNLNRAKRAVMAQIHETRDNLLSEDVDSVASQTSLDVLAEAAKHLEQGSKGISPDFYRDGNIAEAYKLYEILQVALQRITELIAEWPEQMVLSDLADRCKALLAIPASAPIAKMLAFVESLLFKIADWEAYASRETSLQTTTDRLTSLVVNWRRLELQSWAGLLRTQENTFREPVAEWWFRLYDLCIQGPQAWQRQSDHSSNTPNYVENLVQVVRTFLETSPAGQFSDRLRLVQGFASFTHGLSDALPLYLEISVVLRNVAGFYAQTANRVEDFMREERLKIEKDVNEVIRLASWKDVNIYALKASAQKSHGQLYKRVRALRKVLDTPVSRFIGNDAPKGHDNKWTRTIGSQATVPTVLQAYTPSEKLHEAHLATLSRPLVNLKTTVKRLEIVVKADISKAETTTSDGHLEELSDTIIRRSRELRAEQPTASTKEERLKQAKTLMDRKRKAWSSLLAEVKRIGLSPRPPMALIERLKSLSFLFNAKPLSNDFNLGEQILPFEDIAKSVDIYYYRLCALMPQVRSAASQHHSDVIPSQLQAAAGSLDSSLSMLHSSRKDLYHGLRKMGLVMTTHRQLESVARDGVAIEQPQDVGKAVGVYFESFMLLIEALSEVSESGQEHSRFMSDADKRTFMDLQDDLKVHLQASKSVSQGLASLVDMVSAVPASVTVAATLGEARNAWKSVMQSISTLSHVRARFAYLLDPVASWMNRQLSAMDMATENGDKHVSSSSAAALTAYSSAMSGILVVVQNLEAIQEPELEETDEYPDGGLSKQYRQLRERSALLRLDEVELQLQRFTLTLRRLASDPQQVELAKQLVERSLPFVASYLALVQSHMDRFIVWYRALIKFAYIFAQTTLTLATEGFCRPTESEEGPSEASTFEGTGMGSGEGSKNVSDEIENQEQVEGLENEQEQEDDQSNQKDEKDGKDDMLDMEDDFGGKTQDVDQQESGDQSDDDEQEEQDDVEEELGKVDPLDPSAVDDKFWDDKEEPKDEGQSPEPEEQSGQDPGTNDSGNMGERQEAEKDSKDDPAPQDKKDAAGDDAKLEDEQQEGDSGPEETEEDGVEAQEGPRHELPDMNLDEQTLDLPDNLDLDLPANIEEEDDEIDDELEPDMPDNADGDKGDESDEANGDEGTQDGADPKQEEEGVDEQTGMNEDEGAFSHESTGAEGGTGIGAGSAPDLGEAQEETEAGNGENGADETTSSEAKRADAMELEDPSAHQSQPTAAAEASMENAGNDAGGEGPSVSRPSTNKNPQTEQPSQNTERQLGDSKQDFMRRLEAISDPSDQAFEDNGKAESDPANNQDVGEVEYAAEGEETELQAMGAAAEQDAAKGGMDAADAEMLDEFQSMELEQNQAAEDKVLLHHIPDPAKDARDPETSGEAMPDDRPTTNERDNATGDSSEAKQLEETLPEEDVLPRAEVALQHWLADGRESLPVEEVWRLYTNLTRDLSFSLTESLRLVLEPTLATRLKGDYRTGKRLNMRKIIPYIASDYTKDKIWLRRTRPSQREYQVLLALDDSRSMADSRAVHLAYQTLALVCQSLTKLEVGEVSICKFGEHTDFIHKFEDGPVSDAVGANIVNAFSFAQNTTDVRRLLESSLQRFQEARDRRGGTSADLWQLEIIVSDGMCQDLEDIRSLLRKAREQKVMVMFVVLDSLHQDKSAANGRNGRENSILSMKSVSYQKSKSGALELKMERYMDTFPFEYYVVLRDVDTLPEVLGDTLRQFFDKVRGND
ncbi:P-loop containing nucleoside triphosphate hydrolase protein [Cystobasidium minutum MCA 4210]|uniref:P-loop containing nucleoside triphosphate hydrolase protein n=1 Tax=Cystobasidium minutum MCA 4210 TaxID=1397322 RepID=UPI0034CD023C|eukprot:jgi/Rhomi1/205979/MIX6808_598_93